MRFFLISLFCLSAMLGEMLWSSVPAAAQPQSQTRAAPKSKGQPATGANSSFPVSPLLLGVGLGGLVLGAVLGSARKKPAPVPVSVASEPPFEETPLPLATIDARERLTRANPAFSAYLGVPEAAGAAFPDWFHPDDLAQGRTLLHEIFGGDRADFRLSIRLFRPDGEMLHADLHAQKQGKSRKPDLVWLALSDQSARMRAEFELEGAREAISALYEVIAGDHSRPLDDKMKALLSLGCNRFKLPFGALSRLTPQGLETLYVQSTDRRLRPALVLPRGDTSFEGQLLGLTILPHNHNWQKHPFVVGEGKTAYIGAPVLVSDELFGMLSFSDLEGRETEWDSGDIQLLQLMAEWVGGEIERDDVRAALEKQQKQLVEVNEKLEMLATHDPLTGAKNRRAFNEKLEEEWARARRYQTPLSLILFDVDHFKSFNDTFGHPAGDEVLKRVARLAMAGIRTTDFFARYGGEEFILILPNTDADGALVLADRLREKIEKGPWKERTITVSLGVANPLPDHPNAAALTQTADNALYKSKENGRNRVTHARDLGEVKN